MSIRAMHLVFAAVFALSAAVQFNDPDPVPWILIYCGAGLSSARAARGVPNRWLAAMIGVVASSWAGWIAWQSRGPLLAPSHFVHWEMKGGAAEEAREIGGLFIVFLGSALVVAGARGLTPGGRAPGSR